MTSFFSKLVGVGSVKLIRKFHGSCKVNHIGSGSYEGEGKTTITVLNKDLDYGLMVDGLSPVGFKLNNGIWIFGPTIIFPRSVIGWNIKSSEDITDESLTLFKIIEPRLDILVVGLDQKYSFNTPFINTLKDFSKRHGTSLEILPVEHACTTFNFLNAEKRYVAAALMPPKNDLPRNLKTVQETARKRRLSKIPEIDKE